MARVAHWVESSSTSSSQSCQSSASSPSTDVSGGDVSDGDVSGGDVTGVDPSLGVVELETAARLWTSVLAVHPARRARPAMARSTTLCRPPHRLIEANRTPEAEALPVSVAPGPGGENGKRGGLKTLWRRLRAGSNPALGTTIYQVVCC